MVTRGRGLDILLTFDSSQEQTRLQNKDMASSTILRVSAMVGFAILLQACISKPHQTSPRIAFTEIPQCDADNSGRQEHIGGSVIGFRPGQQVVLYARRGNWWLQPLPSQPFTPIQSKAVWSNATHLGTEYAALLVNPGFHPPPVLAQLPKLDFDVLAVASSKGQDTKPSYLAFSGYEWRIRNAATSRGGKNFDAAKNAWVDASGLLHLRISREAHDWTSAELSLTRSLGYGTYSCTVRDSFHLEPAAVFSIFTWDYSARAQDSFNSEMDIEISRWGDPSSKNAQVQVQPYYAAANVFRFSAPAGVLTHSFQWEPNKVIFTTRAPRRGTAPSQLVSQHIFTSQVPFPGMESLRLNLYPFRGAKVALTHGAEIIIENFEYLP